MDKKFEAIKNLVEVTTSMNIVPAGVVVSPKDTLESMALFKIEETINLLAANPSNVADAVKSHLIMARDILTGKTQIQNTI